LKSLIALAFILAPAMLVAQTAAKPTPDAASTTAGKAKTPANRTPAKAGVAASAPDAPDTALTTAQLALAERVHFGRLPCELGAFVTVTPDEKAPGYFIVEGSKFRFRMFPVETSTGAIRLEDRANGAVWIQLANKSMLMNQKAGQRLADECHSPRQLEVAAALAKNPSPSLLEALPAASTGGGTPSIATLAVPVPLQQSGGTTTVTITSTPTITITSTTTMPAGTGVAAPSVSPASAPR
jgi:hypothetical protein